MCFVIVHIGVGYLGVARSDWLGNARALIRGTSNKYRFPRFSFYMVKPNLLFEPSGSGSLRNIFLELMRIIQYLCVLFLCLFYVEETCSQTSSNGYIVSVEGNAVYVDLTTPKVKVGDELGVYIRSGYMTDPSTGRRIRKADELMGRLKISSVHQGYSIAHPIENLSVDNLKEGMTVKQIKFQQVVETGNQRTNQVTQNNNQIANNQITPDYLRDAFVSSTSQTNHSQQNSNPLQNNYSSVSNKATVVVAPAQVNDVVNSGHFGGYVADVLMEQLLMCNEVRVLDRSVLNAQIDEVNLAGDIIDPATAIQQGKVVGARYMIQVTMQKPDVVNVRTGIPIASVMGAVGAAVGKNIGAQYASNVRVGTLKASVSINARVVDLQTGEILFMASGIGNAKGKSQLALEYGALGGGEINGGADGFKQTVTGKAIQQAFVTIGRNLRNFFSGNTDRKVMGSTTGYGSYGQQMAARGMKLYMGTEKLDKEGVAMALSEHQNLYFKYKNAKKKQKWGNVCMIMSGICGVGLVGLAGNSSGDMDAVKYIAGGTITVASVIGGLCLHSSAKKRLRQIANEYNRSQNSYADAALNLVLDNNSLGLRLTF